MVLYYSKGMQFLRNFFASLFGRKRRDDQWAARFDNQPTPRNGNMPLDPGKSELS